MLTKLRPYQQEIVNQVMQTNKSTLIQIPTGGGKTIIAKEIIIDLINHNNYKVLFLAPKIVLMEQTMEVFKGLKPQIIHGVKKYDKNHHIFISTLQTASRRELDPDVIIIDEIHYGYDGNMIEKLIKDKHNTRIIGLSATPYDKNGRLLKGFDLILDQYDMNYMIQNNYLVPLRSFVLTRLVLDNVKVIAGDYNLEQLGKVVCDQNTILEIVKTTKEYINSTKKTIVFAVNIEHAKLLAKAYEDAGFKSIALHSKLPKETISKEIESFRLGYNNVKVLVSVLMLTTGFDVPDTDCAVIARPTKSQNLYKQMVGRILRKAPNKKEAILLDCGNVIENLGMPLDPIKVNSEITANKTNKMVCESCSSEKLKLKKLDDETYWLCRSCGAKKIIEKNTYRCNSCNKSFDNSSDFFIENNSLYLKCICDFDTLISELQGDEALVEITNNLSNDIRELENKPLSLGEFITTLVNRWEEHKEESHKLIERIKEIKLSNSGISSLQEDSIKISSNYFEKLNKLMQNKKYEEIMSFLDNVEKKYQLSPNKILNMFEEWYVLQKNRTEDWKIELFSNIDKDSGYRLLVYFIDKKYMSLSDIMSILYENDLYNTMNYLIDLYEINYFDYYLENDNIFSMDDTYTAINESFIRNLTKEIQYFDIGKSLLFDGYIDYWEDGVEYEDFLLEIVDSAMYLDSILDKYNIKGTFFGKSLSFKYVPFEEAKEYIQSQKITSLDEWLIYAKDINRSIEIPRYPNLVYKEWKSWEDWFGKAIFDAENFTSVLQSIVDHQLLIDDDLGKKLKIISNFMESKMKKNDEVDPLKMKKNDEVDPSKYLPYDEAVKWVHKLKIKSKKEWQRYSKGLLEGKPKFPDFIPVEPHIVYQNKGWTNTDYWLGLKLEEDKDDEIKLLEYLESSKNELLKPLLNYSSNRVEDLKNAIENNFLKVEVKIQNEQLTHSQIESLRKSIDNLNKYFIEKVKLYT